MDELEVMGLAELPQYAELLGNDVLSSALFHFSLLGFCIWGFVVTYCLTKA